MRGTSPARAGAVLGLLAATLFGISAPLSKLLLPASGPLELAGLLYLGGGLGLVLFGLARRCLPGPRRVEAPIRRGDVPLLAGVILTGGILGPVLMLTGLQRMSAVTGSLLLNLEAPFTMLLAIVVFREHLGRRELGAAVCIVGGAVLLGIRPGEIQGDWIGIAAIAGACLSWAIDNNLTQRLSLRDPIAVVRIKALGAGTCNLLLAALFGRAVPAEIIGGALALGAASYGASILLDMYALRLVGAAREAAYFATAPFIGAVAAMPLTGAILAPSEMIAGGLMALGVVALLREHHSHLHVHEPIEHEHMHEHDDHHQHQHDERVAGPHSHVHRHEPLVHDHPHVSDLHHRHRHD